MAFSVFLSPRRCATAGRSFIDDVAYESILVERADFAEYVKSSKEIDLLHAQAKYLQDYFQANVPSMVITDYGPSSRKKPDGSEDRLFYLGKKENLLGNRPRHNISRPTPHPWKVARAQLLD